MTHVGKIDCLTPRSNSSTPYKLAIFETGGFVFSEKLTRFWWFWPDWKYDHRTQQLEKVFELEKHKQLWELEREVHE